MGRERVLKTTVKGHRITEALKSRGLTKAELATATNISRTQIGRLANDESSPSKIQTVNRIAEALNCSVGYLEGSSDQFGDPPITGEIDYEFLEFLKTRVKPKEATSDNLKKKMRQEDAFFRATQEENESLKKRLSELEPIHAKYLGLLEEVRSGRVTKLSEIQKESVELQIKVESLRAEIARLSNVKEEIKAAKGKRRYRRRVKTED